jgi:hypothetical protein
MNCIRSILIFLIATACSPAEEPTRYLNLTPTSACDPGQVLIVGVCVPEEAPAGWTCDSSSYLAADGCHCGCGVPDPDCLVVDQPVVGCEHLDNATCAGGVCSGDPRWSCSESYYGTGDGCDCGCGAVDPDCPAPLTVDACDFDSCAEGFEADPEDPTACVAIELPAGWTCGAGWLTDGVCECGCGIADPECPADLTIDDCYFYYHGCGDGGRPDPASPAACVPVPAGWDCNGMSYGDGDCTCGCGAPDSDCPSELHVRDCVNDGCGSWGDSPDPYDPLGCVFNPPQDGWECDMEIFFDGEVCDCGCGRVDPDCDADGVCDVEHCSPGDEIDPEDLGECREICEPPVEPVGDAVCTNGGESSVSINGAVYCTMSLSACTDGNRYMVECGGGDCTCYVNGACVAHTSGYCGSVQGTLNGECGWSLVDDR